MIDTSCCYSFIDTIFVPGFSRTSGKEVGIKVREYAYSTILGMLALSVLISSSAFDAWMKLDALSS